MKALAGSSWSSYLIVTSSPNPPTLSHRVLRGMQTRGDDPNKILSSLEACWRRVLTPWPDASYKARWWGDRPVSGTQQSTHGQPPPIDSAEQLLPRSYRSALSQLRSDYCSKLQSYRHSVGWADDPHLSQLPVHRQHGGPSLQLPCTSHGPGSRGYVGGTHPGSSIHGRALIVQRSASTTDRFWLLSLLTLNPSVGRLLLGLRRHHIIFISPLHPILISPVVLRTPTSPLSNNNTK